MEGLELDYRAPPAGRYVPFVERAIVFTSGDDFYNSSRFRAVPDRRTNKTRVSRIIWRRVRLHKSPAMPARTLTIPEIGTACRRAYGAHQSRSPALKASSLRAKRSTTAHKLCGYFVAGALQPVAHYPKANSQPNCIVMAAGGQYQRDAVRRYEFQGTADPALWCTRPASQH